MKYQIISQDNKVLYPFLTNSIEEALNIVDETIENLKKYKDKAHLQRVKKWINCKFQEKKPIFAENFEDCSLIIVTESNRNMRGSSYNISRSYDSNIVSSIVDNYLNRQSSKSYGR